MLIDKELVIEAKEKYGDRAIEPIKEFFKLENWIEKDLKGSCPLGHSDSNPSFIWNSKNQSFHCFSCNKNYGIIDLYMERDNLTYLGAVEKLFNEVKIDFKFSERGVRTSKEYKYPKHERGSDRSKVEEYLSLRKISKETLDAFDVQQDINGNIAFHYYDLNDNLMMVKYRPSHKVSKSENKSWAQVGADTIPLLYNINKIDPTKPLVVTEGEIDSLSVYESGFYNVVSVPFGANSYKWIEENYEWLEQFEKIIIWSDGDKAGLDMRREACSRLGIWRTMYVEIPDELKTSKEIKDANAVLFTYGKEKVLDLINNAQEMPMVGVDDLSTVDDFDLENAPGLYTHLKPVDDIIYKFLFGSVVLLTGIKGSGKSTFINQSFICESLDQGQDIFVYSGELSASVLKSWLELTMAGREKITMKNKFIHVVDLEAKKQMRSWYKGRVWVYNQNDNSSDAVLDRAINVTRKYGVKTWIIDNLMCLDIGETDNNSLQKQKEFIVKLVGLAKTYGVLIILIGHPRKIMAGAKITSDDISGSSNLGNMVQYIVSVHRFTEDEKRGKKDSKGNYKVQPIDFDVELSILKNRYTGKIGSARLYFDYPSYRFYESSKELWKRYRWNKENAPIPTNDPNSHTAEPDFIKD